MTSILDKKKIKELIKCLDMVYENDQKYRKDFQTFIDKYGTESKEVKMLVADSEKLDYENLKIVTQIIEKYGWLGEETIGFKASQALFLVIQHSSIETQLKYFPIFKKAVENGNARKCDLALLEDRIAVRQGMKQIYGTQLSFNEEKQEYYVSPLINPMEVDKRRKEMGLNSLDEYISYWGLTWDYEKGESKHKTK